jgi:predicted lipoprotein with Yx(FWY)xxD motif
MPAPSAIHRPARLASLAIAAIALLTACTAASTGLPATPAAASPAAVASQSPEAIASPADASPPTATGSPGPKGGRSYGGGATDTPAPKPRTTPKPTPKPTVKRVTVRTASTGLGKVLVGSDGTTLYIRTSDGMNASGCNGSCADNWPPFTVKSGTKAVGGSGVRGTFGTITRSDGAHQVTYKGKPLYAYVGDDYAGDTNGQGIGGVWYVAKP